MTFSELDKYCTEETYRHLKAFRDYLDAPAEVGDVPATVCLRHGRHVPCRRGEDDCLLSSHPNMIRLVDVYQRNTDSVRWDFEHVVKSWLYLMKGEGNW